MRTTNGCVTIDPVQNTVVNTAVNTAVNKAVNAAVNAAVNTAEPVFLTSEMLWVVFICLGPQSPPFQVIGPRRVLDPLIASITLGEGHEIVSLKI